MLELSKPYKLSYKPRGGLFYGIRGLIFIWHGEWSDPEVYDATSGLVFNSFDLEYPLWDDYRNEGGDTEDLDAFDNYVKENSDKVWECIDYIKSYFNMED